MKKELGAFLYELAFQNESEKRKMKIWCVFDNDNNLIASATPPVLWAVLGVMFSTKLIKEVSNKDRTIILDCKCVLKEGD